MEMKTHYTHLVWPRKVANRVPISPGLFQGTYSAHGLELIMLSYEDDEKKVRAVKISGDPNVPAGQVTFRADLPYCIYLDQDQQTCLEGIAAIEPVMSDINWNEMPPSQPFVQLPEFITDYKDIPDSCQFRYFFSINWSWCMRN